MTDLQKANRKIKQLKSKIRIIGYALDGNPHYVHYYKNRKLAVERLKLAEDELRIVKIESQENIEPITKKMKDVNGILIKVGDFVKTTQPQGGILPPSKPTTGVVEKCIDAFGDPAFRIRYNTKGFDQFILLTNNINLIIKTV